MSVHFMLSQRSLKLSLFLFFFHFSVQFGYFHILCLPVGWSCSSISFKPLLIRFSVFFISVMVLFRFSLCSSILLPSLVSIFMIITLKVLLGRLLISSSFSSVSEVVSHSLIWTYSSLLFCLMLWVYFYFLGRWVMFPSLQEVAFCRRLSYAAQKYFW